MFCTVWSALLVTTYEIVPALLKGGHAVLVPIYKGTYERGGGGAPPPVDGISPTVRDKMIVWAKDAFRPIDFLDTRSNLDYNDYNKVAYYGYSLGAHMGIIIAAMSHA